MRKVAFIGVLVAVMATLFFTQCEKTEDIQPFVNTKEAIKLIDQNWHLEQITKGREIYEPEMPISLEFYKSSTKLRFSDLGSCSAHSVLLNKNRLDVDGKYACNAYNKPMNIPGDLGATAKVLHNHFQGEISYFVKDEKLIMQSPTATFTLTKEPMYHTVDPYPFAGTEWELERIWGTNMSHYFKDRPVLRFDEKMIFLGWSDNKCKKSYSNQVGNYLQLDVEAFECKTGCCSHQYYEQLVLALSGRQSYRMENGSMVLTNSKGIKVYLNQLK
jgi:uncharacterized protein YxeA